jgi:hypothetical protein
VPTVQISGAPQAIVAGTSVQLEATVSNDSAGVTWSVNGAVGGDPASGTISAGGLYKAPPTPPSPATVKIGARSAGGGYDERSVRIDPTPAPQPAPLPPASQLPAPSPSSTSEAPPGASAGPHRGATARLAKPQVMRVGHVLILTTVPARDGVVRLSAYAGKRLLGACSTRTPGGRRFTCRLRTGHSRVWSARIAVVASLRVGGRVIAVRRRPAARVPQDHRH